ncbi:MAG: tryptophan synthase subunit alpha [Phascolarctobacterium sp.]|nr:tryptophan synthase subunit alpha [Phascolarctobacterium sp.]
MNKIAKAFANNKKVLIPSITAGDPDLEATKELILAMEEAGAGVIELGIPFSDPVAEGEEMQRSAARALATGTTTDKIFTMLKELRQETQIPVVLVTYANPIYTYGCEKFFEQCEACGVSGILVPDVPYEEKEELLPYCEPRNIALIAIITPNSRDRIAMIAKEAKGYVYAVSYYGVLADDVVEQKVAEMVEAVRKVTDVPVAVGYRVRKYSEGKAVGKIADGIVVDCRIAEIIEKHGAEGAPNIADYVKKMNAAMNS